MKSKTTEKVYENGAFNSHERGGKTFYNPHDKSFSFQIFRLDANAGSHWDSDMG